jgi:hypothetical protein
MWDKTWSPFWTSLSYEVYGLIKYVEEATLLFPLDIKFVNGKFSAVLHIAYNRKGGTNEWTSTRTIGLKTLTTLKV